MVSLLLRRPLAQNKWEFIMLSLKPIPLIMLGMHRSGTSCLAGTLEQAGVHLGNTSQHNKYNKKGNKESMRIMHLNDALLNYNKASWDKPPKIISWDQEHEVEGRAIINVLEKECTTRYWGFKDPRVLLTLAFWSKLLPEAKYIGTYRDPLSVAKSLNKRKGSSIEIESGLDLWLEYNHKLISFHQKNPFPLISFDSSAVEYTEKLKKIYGFLGLSNFDATDFFDKTLRSQQKADQELIYKSEIKTAVEYLNQACL